MSVNLGDKVRDTVTGFTGISDRRTTYLYGCDRISIQPPLTEDGKIPDCYSFDEPQVEVLSTKVVPSIPAQKVIITLGNTVQDPIKGVEGVATGYCVYLNGCVRILLEPLPEHKDVKEYWVDQHQLVDKNTSILKQNKDPETTRGTGGPGRLAPPR